MPSCCSRSRGPPPTKFFSPHGYLPTLRTRDSIGPAACHNSARGPSITSPAPAPRRPHALRPKSRPSPPSPHHGRLRLALHAARLPHPTATIERPSSPAAHLSMELAAPVPAQAGADARPCPGGHPRAAQHVGVTAVGPPPFSCGAGQRGRPVAAEEAAASMAAAGRGAARAGRTSPFPIRRARRPLRRLRRQGHRR